ncbi:hypothetical protein [Rhodococcus jostii]|uniref:hypothetical protein n=1 Tax=Rhodococcus jostii TaxID=132919 RepID=UPI00363A7B9D
MHAKHPQPVSTDTAPPFCGDFVAATFSPDFVAEGFNRDTLERIHSGAFEEWTLVLARSGLFSCRTLADALRSWQDDPHSLLGALLTDADEVTAKRYEDAWDELDQHARARATFATESA